MIGFLTCLAGVLLPFRARVLFSELIGWMIQGIYLAYFGTLNYLLKSLKGGKQGAVDAE
jgi:hypothetical protein